MIYGNALRDLLMRLRRYPGQMPVPGPAQMSAPGMPQIPFPQPFRPMPFEGGMPSYGKGGRQIPIMGMNQPNMLRGVGRNPKQQIY